MARTKGTANLSGTIEALAGGPLDARSVVPTKADLTVGSNFPYPYIGLETYVTAENKKYRLVEDDPTVEANWEEVGSGGSSVPSGGTTGQALVKHSNTDGDVEWASVIPASAKGTASGVAELDSNGKVPASQLPSYVDDVVEGYYNSTNDRFYEESTFTTLIPPESGKSWVDIAGNKSYRWSGSAYVRVDEGVQLGETSSTAYRGDRGKTAYDFSQAPYTSTPAMDGTGSAGSSSAWAMGDHVHPKDTTKADKVSGATNGDVAILNSSGNLADSGLKPGLDSTDWASIIDPLPGQTSGVKYSTSEQVIGEWLNGSTLYQKTIYISSFVDTAGTTKSTAHGITNLNFVVNAFGVVKMDSGAFAPLPFVSNFSSGDNMAKCSASVTVNTSDIGTNTTYSRFVGQPCYITLQYTKTS